MKWVIFGDVHGNMEALEAVLVDIETVNPDFIFCTGDVVGYGSDPSECIKKIQGLDCPVVAGNHDYAAVGKIDTTYFNLEAHESAVWTSKHINNSEYEYLVDLPLTADIEGGLLVHSSPSSPETFPYIFDLIEADAAFSAMNERLCFIGHSHSPLVILKDEDGMGISYEPLIDLSNSRMAIINVGSVGQPRDNDNRAAYAVYDSESDCIEIKRVEYDWRVAADKIRSAGLPAHNASRLGLGI